MFHNLFYALLQEFCFFQGKFAKEYGAGFILDSIDLSDPNNACNCESAYSPLYYLIDGWKNEKTYPECILFDRSS